MALKFLKSWTIETSKIPKYAAFSGEFVMELDYNLLKIISESKDDVFTEGRKALLLPILESMNGKDTLRVSHCQRFGLGRFYAEKSISPIVVSRHIKHTLFHHIDWIDIDMIKGHPSIISCVAELNGISLTAFKEYIQNSDSVFKMLINYYSVDEDNILSEENVKEIFSICIYGGSHDTWIYAMEKIGKIVKRTAHPFVVRFINEAQSTLEIVYASNKDIVSIVKGSLTDEYKIKKRVMSYWCGIIENDIIHLCYKLLLKRKVIEKRKNIALEYDGLCFKKPAHFDDEVADELVAALNNNILKESGLNVRMKFKGYKSEHRHESIIKLRNELSETEREERNDEDDDEENEKGDNFTTFSGLAKVFEENHAKIINKGMFVKRTASNEIVVMSKTQLITAYENICYWGVDKYRQPEEKTFINEWLRNNSEQRAYDDFGCYPHDQTCPERIYNVWMPFAMELITEYEEKPKELAQVLKHLLIICGNDKKVYEYFVLWIAQMIRCPSRKSNMPVFISEEGSGKGTIMRLFELMLGQSKVFETTKPSRDVWGLFNGQMANCFLVNLNEIGKKECAESDGEIKGLITDPCMTINNKGVGQYKIQSYHRFIATTNKPEPMGTSEGDRRKWFVKCSDELKGDDEYFKSFYAMLEDKNVIKTCYEYFKSLKAADEFHLLEMPKTEYAKGLCTLSKSPIELFIGDYVLGIELPNGIYAKQILASVLFEEFKRWKEDNDMKFEINNISFALKLKNLKIEGLTSQNMAKGYKGYEIDVQTVKKHLGVGLQIETRKTPEYMKELLRLHRQALKEEKAEDSKLYMARHNKKIDEFINKGL